jgi:hypothetical protein
LSARVISVTDAVASRSHGEQRRVAAICMPSGDERRNETDGCGVVASGDAQGAG